MRSTLLLTRGCLLAALLSPGLASAVAQQPPPAAVNETVPPESNQYPLGPDSLVQPAVPAGKTFTFTLSSSKIFPGTTRTITVYIPAGYKQERPACVYVGLDGLGFHAATVFDNLIAQHAMPVTIGVGVAPGTVASARPPDNPRFDRSYEFDSRCDRLARFILEEVLPAVEQHTTPEGLPIRLSNDGNDRAIGGSSTGAIAAFTVAWERPDAFRRVFSSIGTYVGMRGGEQYYVLVRKTEPRPLRIFMQDGVHDEWPGGPEMGDWWMSNQTMERALTFAGYDVRHVWGVGSHNSGHADAVFPDAMRWLWRNWPAPIAEGIPGNPVLKTILQPGENWQIAADGCGRVAQLASDPKGQVFLPAGGSIAPVPTEGNRCPQSTKAAPFAFGADGKLYLAAPVTTRTPASRVAPELGIEKFIVRSNGDIYALARGNHGQQDLWLIRSTRKKVRLDTGLRAAGLALSPDGLWLFVAGASRAGLSYRVLPDGKLDARSPFYDFYLPAWSDETGASTIAMDRTGLAYVATALGVQVFDRNGRVAAILPLPGNVAATALCFGGPGFDTLYVAAGGKIYRRKLHVTGAPPWGPPQPLPPWGAG